MLNVASARAAIAKRHEGLNELYEIEEEITNFNINIKKETRIVRAISDGIFTEKFVLGHI